MGLLRGSGPHTHDRNHTDPCPQVKHSTEALKLQLLLNLGVESIHIKLLLFCYSAPDWVLKHYRWLVSPRQMTGLIGVVLIKCICIFS